MDRMKSTRYGPDEEYPVTDEEYPVTVWNRMTKTPATKRDDGSTRRGALTG